MDQSASLLVTAVLVFIHELYSWKILYPSCACHRRFKGEVDNANFALVISKKSENSTVTGIKVQLVAYISCEQFLMD